MGDVMMPYEPSVSGYPHLPDSFSNRIAQLSGLPRGLSGKKKQLSSVGDMSSTLGWEDPLEESMATHTSILAWRILWAAIHRVTKSWTQTPHTSAGGGSVI